MKNSAWYFVVSLSVMFLFATMLFVGCDSSDNTNSLTIDPEEVELASDGETQVFEVLYDGETVSDLALPIEWKVSDPSIGVIASHSGYKAIYQRRAAGVNIVYAEDQYGSEGYATVNPRASRSSDSSSDDTLTLAANPSPIPVGNNASTVTVSRGVSPYSWSVGDSSYGVLSDSTTAGSQNIYTSKRVGVNTIYVTDGNGASGQINVEQE
ncbi:MAG: hypothetical protein KAH23_04225 [Kiritimatiellae bacterium]|nr:hypothetical protein [Kiritimatiellia bacterium]